MYSAATQNSSKAKAILNYIFWFVLIAAEWLFMMYCICL